MLGKRMLSLSPGGEMASKKRIPPPHYATGEGIVGHQTRAT